MERDHARPRAEAAIRELLLAVGEDPSRYGVVQVKDLILGAKIAAQASVEEWKSQPAQAEVPRGAVIATVREMLAQ